jgi:hypothetical protein
MHVCIYMYKWVYMCVCMHVYSELENLILFKDVIQEWQTFVGFSELAGLSFHYRETLNSS